MNRLPATIAALTMLTATIGRAVEPPQLLSPPDRMEITDVATYFQWLPVAGCTNFEIQVSSDVDFKTIVKSKRTTNKGFHKNLYFPKDVLLSQLHYIIMQLMSNNISMQNRPKGTSSSVLKPRLLIHYSTSSCLSV